MFFMPSGQEDFKQLRENLNFLYVDKTHFIKEWWESYDKVTLLLRPRCFGKTLNMSMIEYFFSNQYENSNCLFKDLFISIDDHIMEHQGQYPVIFLSFGDLQNGNCEFMKNQIKMKIWQVYLNFKKQMLESEKLDVTEKNFINSISHQMDDSIAINSIQILCSLLNKVYENKRAIVLLDKYDSLFNEGSNYESNEVKDFLLHFISSTFKGNKFLLKGLITGIMNITLSTDFNGANNINIYGVTSSKYSNCFGFTKDEVFQLTKFFHVDSNIEEIENWYDGYNIGNELHLFNPYSISQFFNQSNQFSNYWFNTSSNNFIKEVLKNGLISIKDRLIQLIQGESIIQKLKERSVFDNNEESVWILLLTSGYLTFQKVDGSLEYSKNLLSLKMPNNEIIESFSELIIEMFESLNFSLNQFIDDLFNANLAKMEQFLNYLIEKSFSFFDQSQENHEIIYHSLILGLAAVLKNMFYITINDKNDEFCYVVIKSLNKAENQNSYILAFTKKQYQKKTRDISDSAKYALNSISKTQFMNDLQEEDFDIQNIKLFSFAFLNNKCKIAFSNESENDDENTHKKRKKTIYSQKNKTDSDHDNSNESSDDLPSTPNFERSKRGYFNKNDEVYVIDKNQYDIWEAVVMKRTDGNQYSIHYPSFPQDDEKIQGVRRIIPRSKKNIDIFLEQERVRNESITENSDD